MNKVKKPRTEVNYKGLVIPFYKTNRANWDFENAGFTVSELANGSQRAMLAMTFFTMRECAKRANIIFQDGLDEFIDSSDDIDIPAIYQRLQDVKQKESLPEGKSQPEIIPAKAGH
jgi:hypothetical protein